jgi:hypothetical protein
MLARHPRIKSFPETHFFRKAYPPNKIKRFFTWPALNVRGLLKKFVREVGRDDLLNIAYIGLFDRNYHQTFINALDRLTLCAGKDIWVEKTPLHLHYIKEIQKLIPKAKFIHIVRTGTDVVASLYKATNENPEKWAGKRGFHGFTIDQCIKRWNNDVLITSKWKDVANHLVVKYEKLIDSPSIIIKDICSFLEIEYSPLMKRPEQSFNQIVNPDEVWKKNNIKAINKPESTFDTIFTENQRKYIRERLIELNF